MNDLSNWSREDLESEKNNLIEKIIDSSAQLKQIIEEIGEKKYESEYQ